MHCILTFPDFAVHGRRVYDGCMTKKDGDDDLATVGRVVIINKNVSIFVCLFMAWLGERKKIRGEKEGRRKGTAPAEKKTNRKKNRVSQIALTVAVRVTLQSFVAVVSRSVPGCWLIMTMMSVRRRRRRNKQKNLPVTVIIRHQTKMHREFHRANKSVPRCISSPESVSAELH